MRIIFATGNENKISEASGIFSHIGFEVEPLLIAGNFPDLIEPQADRVEETALSKLNQARDLVIGTEFEGEILLAEDSGLFIDSLSGFPGPYSSYIERTIGLNGILKLLEGESKRGAEFRAVAAFSLDGKTLTTTGICRGTISEIQSGSNGFGFDPIFIPEEGDGRTCGDLSPEEKSIVSHRGMALKAVSGLLNPPSK